MSREQRIAFVCHGLEFTRDAEGNAVCHVPDTELVIVVECSGNKFEWSVEHWIDGEQESCLAVGHGLLEHTAAKKAVKWLRGLAFLVLDSSSIKRELREVS